MQSTLSYELELNGPQSLSSVILPSKVNRHFIEDVSELWTIIDDNFVEHTIVYVKKRGEGDLLSVEIKAVPRFFDAMDVDRIEEEYNEHMTANVAFGRIFADTDFTFALIDSFDAVQWEGFGGGESKLETFKRAIDRYKAEFRIVGNTVYLHKLIGRDTQFQYRHKLNASNIEQENDATALWTYAKGYGDYEDGSDENEQSGGWQSAKLVREYTSPLANILGIRKAPSIKDGRVKVASAMDSMLKTLVDESLKISVSADITDLRRQGYALAQPELGDRVFLIDERIGLDEEVRVISIKYTVNWRGDITDFKLTFGSPGIVRRHQSNLATAINNINGIMNGTRKIPFTAYDDAVIIATDALKRIQSELVIPENGGLLSVDKNNPNNVVVFNAAGIGVSTDGGATFGYAMTANGINGKYIVANTITAEQLNVNRLSQVSNATGKLEVTDDILMTEVNKGIYMSFENLDSPTGGSIQRLLSGTGRLAKHNLRFTGMFKQDDQAWRNADTLIGLDHVLLREYFRNADGSNGNIRYRTDFTAGQLFMTNVGSGVVDPQQYSKVSYDNIEIKNFGQHAFYRGNMIRIDGPEYSIDGINNESFFRFINGETARIVRSTRIAANQSSASGGLPVYVSQNNNNLYVSTSSEKYKINIERGERESDIRLLEVPVARWNDKQSAEYMSDLLTDEYEGMSIDWDSDERAILVDNLDRSVGFIAEDLYDLGLVDYLIFDGDSKTRDNIVTIQYDRLVVPLLAIVQRQQKQIDEIKEAMNIGRIN